VSARKKRVVFVCLGNACRSQMAEGFAKTYGKDVMEAGSAGLTPLTIVPKLTREAMEELNIDLTEHFPKSLQEARIQDADLVVNMSGFPLPVPVSERVLEWQVVDPFGRDIEAFRRTRDDIEMRVQRLILELRRSRD
jgi:arsenate reductase (thioredoxin)